LVAAGDAAFFHMSYLDDLAKRLNDANDTAGWSCALQIPRSQLVSILDRVRTLVLDWALNLERAGIMGTEFNFNSEEKQKAQTMSTTINIGHIGAFTGNLGYANTSGDISAADTDVKQVQSLIDQLNAHATELGLDSTDQLALASKLTQLENEIKKEKPSRSAIRGLLDRKSVV